MELGGWLTTHWFTLLQTVGIVGSLWYTARSFRLDADMRRMGNYFSIASQHSRIWSQLYANPKLSRVLESHPDLDLEPVTAEEVLFVTLLVAHIHAVHLAKSEKLLDPLEGAEDDIHQFFSKPIPKTVWERIKALQNNDLRDFIDSVINA